MKKDILNNRGVVVPGSCHSRGKLLITGEYLILRGAMGLALPLQRGQSLEWFTPEDEQIPDYGELTGQDKPDPSPKVSSGENLVLDWTTVVNGREWFTASFSGDDYRVASTTGQARAGFVGKVLAAASRLSALAPFYGRAVSRVDFDMNWGFGSSSSLISNLAYMFDVDPFALHFSVSGGSGYDIACARAGKPVLYRLNFSEENQPLPVYRSAGFSPPFSDRLFFAWTGRKQDSADSVASFKSGLKVSESDIREVSRISEEITGVKDPDVFTGLLKEHDGIVSSLLGEAPANKGLFRSFPCYVKSLGAWGGDFVMIVWNEDVDGLLKLLKQKGMDVVFQYDKLIHYSDD